VTDEQSLMNEPQSTTTAAGSGRARHPPPPRATGREWGGLAVLALPTLLVAMDLTVLHLAVPHLSADLQPTSAQLLWIVDIYGFVVAGSLITMGTLGDRIGRRRLLLAGAATFGVASVTAALANSAGMLIATRALLGVAGATLLPSTLGLIRYMFVDPRQRGLAIGVWAAVFSAGTAVGPVLGGALLERFWWGSVFLIGVPAMLALLVLGPALLPEYRDPHAGRLDLVSAALSLVGVLAVIYGLKQIAEHGGGVLSVLSIAAGLAVGVVFVLRQRVLVDPLIDLRLFGVPVFSASLAAETFALLAWAGTYLFLAQYLQLVKGLSPLEAGVWLLPAAGASIAGSMLAPLLVRRTSPAVVVSAGLGLAAGGFGLLTRVDQSADLAVLVTGSVVFSLGIAPTVTLGTDLIVGAAPPEQAGAASAISETGTELGLALGVAVIGSIGTAVYRGDLADAMPPGVPASISETARDTLGGALASADALPARLGADLVDAAREAFTHGLHVAAACSAAVAVVLAFLAGVLLRTSTPRADTFPTSGAVNLGEFRVDPSIAVSDMAQARTFYEDKLGLSGTDGDDGSRVYRCGHGTLLHVYPSAAPAAPSTATLATWRVPDVALVVDQLRSRGVRFERYENAALDADENGIHTKPGGKVAWFRDPDGNTFAVEQSLTGNHKQTAC
jgi:DHA2 family multidrug resistance protein-like MFS transporter